MEENAYYYKRCFTSISHSPSDEQNPVLQRSVSTCKIKGTAAGVICQQLVLDIYTEDKNIIISLFQRILSTLVFLQFKLIFLGVNYL